MEGAGDTARDDVVALFTVTPGAAYLGAAPHGFGVGLPFLQPQPSGYFSHQSSDLFPGKVFGIPSSRGRNDPILRTRFHAHIRSRKQHSRTHDLFPHAESFPRALRGSDARTGAFKYTSTSSGVRNAGST